MTLNLWKTAQQMNAATTEAVTVVVVGSSGVRASLCSSLQFVPQVITINDSVLLVNQPG